MEDSRKTLTAGEIEELKEEIRTMPHKEFFGENLQPLAEDHSRLLSLLHPPPDAAVREAVNENRLHEAEQRVQQNYFSICARYDLEQELRIALASLRAVHAPRLTPEQVERLRESADTLEAHGEVLEAQWLRAAFPELAGEVKRG